MDDETLTHGKPITEANGGVEFELTDGLVLPIAWAAKPGGGTRLHAR